jgi:hypothetical protein
MRPFKLIDTEPREQVRQIAVEGELEAATEQKT